MTPEQVELMLKITKDHENFKKWVIEALERKIDKEDFQKPTVLKPTTSNNLPIIDALRTEPICNITMARDASLPGHNIIHDKIRNYIIEYCKDFQIQELEIKFKK